MPTDKAEAIAKLKEKLGDVKIEELKDGKIKVISDYGKEYVDGYTTKKEAIAESAAKMTKSAQYHYQGIIQDMKKPLVVE